MEARHESYVPECSYNQERIDLGFDVHARLDHRYSTFQMTTLSDH